MFLIWLWDMVLCYSETNWCYSLDMVDMISIWLWHDFLIGWDIILIFDIWCSVFFLFFFHGLGMPWLFWGSWWVGLKKGHRNTWYNLIQFYKTRKHTWLISTSCIHKANTFEHPPSKKAWWCHNIVTKLTKYINIYL